MSVNPSEFRRYTHVNRSATKQENKHTRVRNIQEETVLSTGQDILNEDDGQFL